MRYHEIISESVHQDKPLPEVKAEIEARLSDDLPKDEHELLLQQHGIIDDLNFDEAGNLTIYRSMWVTPTWIKQAKPGQSLGIYWSHAPNTASPYNAETFGADGEVDLLIEAILPAQYADWAWIWEFHHQGENEVRLGHKESRIPLKVTRIWINQKPVRLRNWINQTYTD